ncbi:MAG: site-specific integrase [Pseudomonadota bacterium]
MTTYRKKQSPYYHYDFQFRGKRYHGSTNCTSKREADAFERRMRHEAANPRAAQQPLTIDEACGLYAEHAETQSSWPTTRYILKSLVKSLGKSTLLSTITQRDLQLHFAKRRDRRSNASVNREVDVARAVWWRAKRTRFDIGEMPEWKSLYLKIRKAPHRELSHEQESAVFEAIAQDAQDVLLFALISGWRRAEVIGLRWSDVALDRAEARTRVKGGDIEVRPLDPTLVALIANQPKVGPFVFTYVCRKSRGKRRAGERYPLTVTALRTRWDEARKAAELRGFRWHDLRHTAATRILRQTQNLAVTAKVLRHKNLKTTMGYAYVLDDDIRDAIAAGQSRNNPELKSTRLKKAK